jgi:uncharacterized protein (DUF608 family)
MGRSELSWDYAKACRMMHALVAHFYEELHNDNGDPITKSAVVENKIYKFQERIGIEIDMVREACMDEK